MIYLLIFTIPAAFFVLYKLPFWEAARDKKAFDANGSADTLHQAFHFWRGARRGVLQGLIVAGAAAPLLAVGFAPWGRLAAGLGVASLGWFFFAFNPQLSRLRGLDPYYLSADPRAALFPDRLLTKLGWGLKPVSLALLCLSLAIGLAAAVSAIGVAAAG